MELQKVSLLTCSDSFFSFFPYFPPKICPFLLRDKVLIWAARVRRDLLFASFLGSCHIVGTEMTGEAQALLIRQSTHTEIMATKRCQVGILFGFRGAFL